MGGGRRNKNGSSLVPQLCRTPLRLLYQAVALFLIKNDEAKKLFHCSVIYYKHVFILINHVLFLNPCYVSPIIVLSNTRARAIYRNLMKWYWNDLAVLTKHVKNRLLFSYICVLLDGMTMTPCEHPCLPGHKNALELERRPPSHLIASDMPVYDTSILSLSLLLLSTWKGTNCSISARAELALITLVKCRLRAKNEIPTRILLSLFCQ